MPKPSVAAHFEGKPDLRKIYDRLLGAAAKLGPFAEDPKKTSIHLNRVTAFAGVALRKDCLVLTIKSDQPIASPRIVRSQHTSARRWHHEVKLFKLRDIDAELRRWFRAAYDLSGK